MTHQWAFINDTWNVGRFSFNGGVRLDSFKPYYEEQGKDGQGPFQEAVTYPGFEFHSAERLRAARLVVYDVFGTGRTAIKLAYGRYSYNAGTMTNANSMMAGFVNPMARTTRRVPVGRHAAVRAQPGQPALDTGRRQPHPRSEPGAALHRRIRRRPRSAAHGGHDGALQLRAEARTQPHEAAEHRDSVRRLQHSGRVHRSRPRLRLRPPTTASSRSTASTGRTSAGAPTC